ncbi:hypothetical protein [Dyadobacter chenhuakuii]|uniref:Uncharacterized protein n=1 Tax=Dyadobacter chenhuakuii TaxID=2909339 RepID=A0A9X1QA89_9BACT|nr:hypothetical protein [Dyadobacter chenhuakuii]MCF2496712.1 hypothetical protein [Dyadobacter chenhuakuii]
MKKLAWLLIFFIIIDRIGLLANVVVMNSETATPPTSVGELIEALGFMLIFAFWHWVALYSCWVLTNLLLVKCFNHSLMRSIVAGASLPIGYLFLGTTWFLVVWNLAMGTAFGFFFHKFGKSKL